jgi:hypothetical protein
VIKRSLNQSRRSQLPLSVARMPRVDHATPALRDLTGAELRGVAGGGGGLCCGCNGQSPSALMIVTSLLWW